MSDDMQCPYCGSYQKICHDDGQGYDEGVLHEHECSECNKSFVFTTSISFYYEPSKADCLNGAEHRFEPTCTWPKELTRMECLDCGLQREFTEEERTAFMLDRMKSEYKL